MENCVRSLNVSQAEFHARAQLFHPRMIEKEQTSQVVFKELIGLNGGIRCFLQTRYFLIHLRISFSFNN